jgi:hypothetical protein
VEGGIGIGMTLQLRAVGNADAAEPDGIAGLEGVNVVAGAGARLHGNSCEQSLGALEILGVGKLEVAGAALSV